MGDDFLGRLLFIAVYTPFAVAALAYVVTGGAIEEAVMVEAAILPWWLPLAGAPVLLALLFIALGRLDLDEFV